MEVVLPVKRTCVGMVHFGMTAPNLELLQPVMCPYAGDVLPAEATLCCHSLSLAASRLLGEVSAIHKEERTVDVVRCSVLRRRSGCRRAHAPCEAVYVR